MIVDAALHSHYPLTSVFHRHDIFSDCSFYPSKFAGYETVYNIHVEFWNIYCTYQTSFFRKKRKISFYNLLTPKAISHTLSNNQGWLVVDQAYRMRASSFCLFSFGLFFCQSRVIMSHTRLGASCNSCNKKFIVNANLFINKKTN